MTEPSPAPLMWIDATRPAAGWPLWGMSLVERLLREGARRGLRHAVVLVGPESHPGAASPRSDLHRLHDIDVRVEHATDRSQPLAGTEAASVLVLDGDVVYDDRVIDHLILAGPGHVVTGEGAFAACLSAADLQTFAAATPGDRLAKMADVDTTRLDELPTYVADLRLTMVPFMVRVADGDDLRRVDRLLFHRTFKGVIDAVARYGYYHFVRFTTRWLSRTTVSPNLLTVLSILGIWVAIPCFAVGQIGWGILSAWIGVILDSVDGKLARLTVNLSDAMGSLEHAAAMPGLGLWFVALGWHLSAGQLLSPTPASIACWLLVGTFLADKLLTGGFRKLTGVELFDARPLDAAFHLIAARRNIHLLILTVGAAIDSVAGAFDWMAAGMVASFAFHGVRSAWIMLTGQRRVTTDV
ncbi:MAG TPA: hypothetical protein QGF95_06285 [Candidatus Latescibacteria bacterium]|jgi:hypothetical protein|nr:hypothetical protein [Gemmatimonadaceae bacterium]MDP6014610.1 CDP-alcohol phosphatidyltransferase family protein [Candidatus Latescibacterota bacterium]HJP30144.1 hypothetical protein [Candidatus Latescibacterota bacterium]